MTNSLSHSLLRCSTRVAETPSFFIGVPPSWQRPRRFYRRSALVAETPSFLSAFRTRGRNPSFFQHVSKSLRLQCSPSNDCIFRPCHEIFHTRVDIVLKTLAVLSVTKRTNVSPETRGLNKKAVDCISNVYILLDLFFQLTFLALLRTDRKPITCKKISSYPAVTLHRAVSLLHSQNVIHSYNPFLG